MFKFALLGLSLLLTGCTYNVSQAHTEGQASDVVDTAQTAEAKPAINVPIESTNSGQTVTAPEATPAASVPEAPKEVVQDEKVSQ